MAQVLGLVSLVVHDYDQALAFYVGTLGFDLVEDSEVPEQAKRWVVVRPPGPGWGAILLARASTPEQVDHVGNQTGGRVFLFLYTDDFERDYAAYRVPRALTLSARHRTCRTAEWPCSETCMGTCGTCCNRVRG
jgi:catechol 2,3-dioxygenase-like lactoylglutathione lyase family enzyme